jgi:arsenate reductase-like glutaredoxin family protein
LEAHGIAVTETVSAAKKLGRDDALAMVRQAQRLIAAKGKKVTAVDLAADTPSDEELAKLMLGPTGNLRAPTMRVGQTIVVGYNDQVFSDELDELSDAS